MAWQRDGMRFTSLALAFVACAVGAAALGSPATAAPHVLVWADGLDINVLNPFVPGAAPNDYMTASTMAFLTRGGKGPIQPELATRVPTQRNGGISKDGKTITFTLRPNLKWSDGEPLTSEDVAFTTGVINDPKTNIGDRTGYERIAKTDTPDATTVVFHLTRPFGQFVAAVYGDRDAPILPKHLLQGKDINTADYMQLPVGAGPFRYSKWVRGDRVELEPNPYYFRGKPKLEKIVYRIIPNEQTATTALRTGEIDFWPSATKDVVDLLKDVPSLTPIVLSGVRPAMFMFNTTSPVTGDPAVRKALRLALNRASIIERSYHGGGELDESIVSKNDPPYLRLPQTPHDLGRAKRLLDAAGWRAGADGVRVKNGKRLHITLAGGAGSAMVEQVLELARADWVAAGAEVETRTYTASILFSENAEQGVLKGGKFDAALFSFGQLRAADLSAYFACPNSAPKGSNYARLCDRTLDGLFARYDATYDGARSAAIARTIQRRIDDLVPAIIIAKRNEYYIVRNTITGYAAQPFAPFSGAIMDVDVSK